MTPDSHPLELGTVQKILFRSLSLTFVSIVPTIGPTTPGVTFTHVKILSSYRRGYQCARYTVPFSSEKSLIKTDKVVSMNECIKCNKDYLTNFYYKRYYISPGTLYLYI